MKNKNEFDHRAAAREHAHLMAREPEWETNAPDPDEEEEEEIECNGCGHPATTVTENGYRCEDCAEEGR